MTVLKYELKIRQGTRNKWMKKGKKIEVKRRHIEATDSSWISFRFLSLMSLMRTAGLLLPFNQTHLVNGP